VFLQDWLVQDVSPKLAVPITVQQSSTVIVAFGIGGVISLIVGGTIVDRYWANHKRRLPLFFGLMQILSMAPLLLMVNVLHSGLIIYVLLSFATAFFSMMVATAMFTCCLHTLLPELRGTAMALFMFTSYLGDALSPVLFGVIRLDKGREFAFSMITIGWLLAAVGYTSVYFTLMGDVERFEAQMKEKLNPLTPIESKV
jgi:MFS family permease